MKTLAWAFFSIYSLGLILSALPAMQFGFLAGLIAIVYVVFSQFWIVYYNRSQFRGFFKSSIFHIVPLCLLTYIIGSQLIYFYFNGEKNVIRGMSLTLIMLSIPYIILWLQYFLLRKAYKPQGILQNSL